MARNADTGESKYVSPSFLTMKQQWQCLWGKKNEQLANVVSSAGQTRRQACSEWAQVSRRDLAWPGQDCSVRAPIARPCFSSVKLHSMENSSFSESKSHVARSICFDSYLFYLCVWGKVTKKNWISELLQMKRTECGKNIPIMAGLEPAIPRSEVWCLIH